MKVSVAMPVYNKAPYLKEALDSIFAQSFTDFEVIAVDDKSTDDSLALLRAYDDPRLKVVELSENLGHPGAKQVAFEHASGEYIVHCDADDVFHSERFAKQVAFMDANPEIGICGCWVKLFGDEDEMSEFAADDAVCQGELLFTTPVHDCAAIVRREVLVRHGIGFRREWPRVGGDWLFMIDLAAVTRFANLDEPLVYYRRGEQNISAKSRSMEARKETTRLGLKKLGLQATPEQVELQMATGLTFQRSPDVALVKALHAWLGTLAEVNSRRGRCPEAVFKARADWVWNRLFYHLADLGVSLAWAHMRSSGGIQLPRLIYLAKVHARRMFGRSPGPAKEH